MLEKHAMKGIGKRKMQRIVHETRPPIYCRAGPDDPFIDTTLASATVESPTGHGMSRARVVIAPYPTMAVGDRIVVAWEDRMISLPPLEETQVGERIVLPIPMALRTIKAMRDIRVTWHVHDAAGVWSRWAPPVFVPVRCSGSYAPTPWLDGTLDDRGRTYVIPHRKRSEIIVRVEGHCATLGDRIVLRFDGVTAAGKVETWSSAQLRLTRDGQTLDVKVPHDLVERCAGGSCQLRYTIYTAHAEPRRSLGRRIEILGKTARLCAPSVCQAEGAVLDPALASGGASVDVPAWPGLAEDDECELVWHGIASDGSVTAYGDMAAGREVHDRSLLTFPVPASEIDRLDGGLLRASYRVKTYGLVETTDGTQRECIHTLQSEWLELRVQRSQSRPHFRMDNLNGLPYHHIDQLRRPYLTVTPVLGTWAVRGGHDAIPPFHEGTFLSASDDQAALRVDFIQPCTSVRFGYGANGPGGNGSDVFIDIFNTAGKPMGEAAYTVPTTGIPGLWVQLHAEDYGAPIAAIVVRKDTGGLFKRVVAQIDNFTLAW
jgi:hypothetical protein